MTGASDFALPRWAYVPGRGAGADVATLAAAKLSVPPRYDNVVPAHDPTLRYGLALNDRGYFWEAHEILEAVWKAAPKGGRDRILLRACIQIANANLKREMNRPQAARRLLCEAVAELDEVAVRRGTGDARDGFADRFELSVLKVAVMARLDEDAHETSFITITKT